MSVPTKRKRKHEDKVSKTIDKVLREIFGHQARLLIYKYIETHYSLRQDEIPEKIDAFAKGLEEYLNSGAHVVETKILEELYSSYGLIQRRELERRRDENDFSSQIRMLMRIR
ncbi:MAG: hypothetical protein ACE5KD_04845 [Candidatus Bathyarchaeia archaeon]